MPATPESIARTRAFARVIGPFITLEAGAVEVRAAEMAGFVPVFFQNAAIVWMTAAMLVVGGLAVVAFHQYWRSPASAFISLYGWAVLMEGLVLFFAPQLMARAAGRWVAGDATLSIRIGFSGMLLIGLWLTYAGWIARSPSPSKP